MDLSLHGKIANIPASEVEVVIDSEAPHRIRVRGRVDERMFYGPKLELQTEISTDPGSNSFQIADVITNQGSDEQEFQILYHANYGPPLLEEGASFAGGVKRVTPFNSHAAKDVARYADYGGPQVGFIEQLYCIHPLADAEGNALIMLQNKARDKAVSMAFAVEELPYVALWKNTNAEGEGYVTGLEPGTGFPNNRGSNASLAGFPNSRRARPIAPKSISQFTLRQTRLPGSPIASLRSSGEFSRF